MSPLQSIKNLEFRVRIHQFYIFFTFPTFSQQPNSPKTKNQQENFQIFKLKTKKKKTKTLTLYSVTPSTMSPSQSIKNLEFRERIHQFYFFFTSPTFSQQANSPLNKNQQRKFQKFIKKKKS